MMGGAIGVAASGCTQLDRSKSRNSKALACVEASPKLFVQPLGNGRLGSEVWLEVPAAKCTSAKPTRPHCWLGAVASAGALNVRYSTPEMVGIPSQRCE